MLLWLSRVDLLVLRTRQGWAARVRASSYEVTRQLVGVGSGTAGESLEGQPDGGSRFVGQAVPERGASVGGRVEVRVDLPGDVTLQTADDLHLGLALRESPFDVDAGAGVGAHAGDDDPP
jgi:hypothetical protein